MKNSETPPFWRRALAASFVCFVAGFVPVALLADVVFTDVTETAGVSYLQHVANEDGDCLYNGGSYCEPERMSGGAAVGDADGDGWLDLYVTRLDATDILFRNNGDGTFSDGTEAAGLGGFDRQTNGAVFADLDNDGNLDLYVVGMGEALEPDARNFMFVRPGNGSVFREVAVSRNAAVQSPLDHTPYSIAVGDYDRDGWLDLHISEWRATAPSHSKLLRNRGAVFPAYFEDVSDAAGLELTSTYAFASAFTDLDRDGWPDLAIAADFGTNRMYWNLGDGTFFEAAELSQVNSVENGMGSAFGDIDGDGDLDWFVTSIFDADETCRTMPCNWGYSGNRLYRNDGDRMFSDATDAAGVREGGWGWGAAFFDADNDGDLDLAMTNGVDFIGTAPDQAFNHDPMRFWQNDGTGKMTERATEVGLTDTASGKGLLVFDYDSDGDLDLFLTNNASTPRLYRNDGGNASDWLRVQTIGTTSNRQGLGAWVALQSDANSKVQVREQGTGGHFLGQSEAVAHFGVPEGEGSLAQLRIRWPSGIQEIYTSIPRRSVFVAVEGEGGCARPGAHLMPTPLPDAPLDADGDGLCDF